MLWRANRAAADPRRRRSGDGRQLPQLLQRTRLAGAIEQVPQLAVDLVRIALVVEQRAGLQAADRTRADLREQLLAEAGVESLRLRIQSRQLRGQHLGVVLPVQGMQRPQLPEQPGT